ncbi:MAG: 2 protein [Ignavibacteria bacterium]|nr:2 protein [Ignavibacteria bacterium]
MGFNLTKLFKSEILKNDFLFYLLIILILIPTLFFPISLDLCVYITGGKTIAEGGKIYYDFVDIKPPMFFYFFSFIYRIFGDGELQLRIFDFIYQFIVLTVLYKLVIKIFENKNLAKISIFIYSFTYSCLTYYATMQTESFNNLFILLLIWNIILNKKYQYIISGLLIGTATSFKLTFILLLPAVLIYYILLNKKLKVRLIKNFIFIFLGLLIPVLFSLILISDKLSFNYYLLTLKFTQFYATVVPMNFTLLKIFVKDTFNFFSEHFSISFTSFALFSLFIITLISENK